MMHAGRAGVRLPNRDGLAALHDERFIGFQTAQRTNDRVERFPRTRRPAVTAVHDEIVGALCHFRIEIILEHSQRRFLRPAFTP